LRKLVLFFAVVFAVLAAGMAGSVSAQVSPTPSATATATSTPAPTATSHARLCSTGTAGGVPIEVIGGVVRVTPPGGGTFAPGLLPPTEGSQFLICFVEGNARVFISLQCREIRRENPGNNVNADAVLDAIVDSCEVIAPTATPQAAATATAAATQAPRPVITPPDTGDAGLR
jgi:hypothetical protein